MRHNRQAGCKNLHRVARAIGKVGFKGGPELSLDICRVLRSGGHGQASEYEYFQKPFHGIFLTLIDLTGLILP
jgi:hypothetical protein